MAPRPGGRPSTTTANFFAAPALERFRARFWRRAANCLALFGDGHSDEVLGRDLLVPHVEVASRGVGHPGPVGVERGVHGAIGSGRAGRPARSGPAPRGWPPGAVRPIRRGRATSRRSHGGRRRAAAPASPTARSSARGHPRTAAPSARSSVGRPGQRPSPPPRPGSRSTATPPSGRDGRARGRAPARRSGRAPSEGFVAAAGLVPRASVLARQAVAAPPRPNSRRSRPVATGRLTRRPYLEDGSRRPAPHPHHGEVSRRRHRPPG